MMYRCLSIILSIHDIIYIFTVSYKDFVEMYRYL